MTVPSTPAPLSAPPAGVSSQTADQIALANQVKEAEARLKAAQAAHAAAATPKITSFVGLPSGPFVIEGENLGAISRTVPGGVRINGVTVTQVTAVRATSIKGTTPVDVKPGKNIRVEVDGAKPFTEGFVG